MSDIFKTYDIRGIYPDDLDEKTAFRVGSSIVENTGAEKVIVGRDVRNSSSSLSESLIEGIRSGGGCAIDIGEIPTGGMYFGLIKYGYGAGVMVTASHNPPRYNGFKMMENKEGFPFPIDISSIKEKMSSCSEKEKGTLEEKNIWDDYLNHLFSFVDLERIKPFKVLVDGSGGMAGETVSKMKERLPIEIIPLNFEKDGNFSSHSPNPLEEGSTDQIKEKMKKVESDFGFIFDGDADRIFLVDNRGNLVSSEVTLLLLAESFLKKSSGESVVYNLLCSKAVPEFIKKWGGEPVKSPVGYSNIWKNMRENKSVLGGETSSHYAFRDNFYSDSAFIAFLRILEVLSKSPRTLSEKIEEFTPYFKISETNFKVDQKDKMINKIKEKFLDGKKDQLDGLTVEYENWWFNVRKSNTEPLLRLNMEANNQDLLEKKKRVLISFIKENS